MSACGKKPTTQTPSKQVSFSGVKDVRISVKEADYDFSNGVIAVGEDGKTLEITIDDSDVKFGTAGKYTVKYDTVNGSKECNVYVYGAPVIETTALDIPYVTATAGDAEIASLITAKDTFGNKVTVKLNTAIALNSNGSVKTGAQQLSVSATDNYGNTTQKTINANVQKSTKTYTISNQNVDFSRAYSMVEIKDSTLLSVYIGETACKTGEYVFDNGCFMLLPKLIAKLGVGEHTLTLNFNDGTKDITLTITDNAEPAFIAEFDLTGETFLEKETITLPTLGKAEYSIQEFDVKTYIKTPDSTEKQELNGKQICLETPGEYEYIAECIKGGTLRGTISQKFTAISLKEYYAQDFVKEEHLSILAVTHNCSAVYEENTTVNGTNTDAFKITIPATATSNNGSTAVALLADRIAGAKTAGYTILNIKMHSRSGFAVYDGEMGGKLLAFQDKAAQAREFELKIELSKITQETVYMYMWHSASEPVDIYVTQLQFGGYVTTEGSLVNASTLDFIMQMDKCTATYEENAEIGDTTAKALRIHADFTKSDRSHVVL